MVLAVVLQAKVNLETEPLKQKFGENRICSNFCTPNCKIFCACTWTILSTKMQFVF